MKELTEGGIYSVDRSYSFIRPRDLISRAVREVGGLVVKYSKDNGWKEDEYKYLYKIDPTRGDRVLLYFATSRASTETGDTSGELEAYLHSRLFDEPDILSTYELEAGEADAFHSGEIPRRLESGFKDYFAFSRSI